MLSMYGSVSAARAACVKLSARERKRVSGCLEPPYGATRLRWFHLMGVAMLLVLDGVNLPGRRLLGGAHYRDLPSGTQP